MLIVHMPFVRWHVHPQVFFNFPASVSIFLISSVDSLVERLIRFARFFSGLLTWLMKLLMVYLECVIMSKLIMSFPSSSDSMYVSNSLVSVSCSLFSLMHGGEAMLSVLANLFTSKPNISGEILLSIYQN